jgi:hypothetical protein
MGQQQILTMVVARPQAAIDVESVVWRGELVFYVASPCYISRRLQLTLVLGREAEPVEFLAAVVNLVDAASLPATE